VFLTALLFPVFVVPIVFLRCWTSQIILGKWHLDDTLAVASLMFALGSRLCIVYVSMQDTTSMYLLNMFPESRLGGGDHISTVSPAGLSLLLKVRIHYPILSHKD